MILVVDDDADVREAIGLFLQADGYRIGRASNGKEAMAWLLSREAPGVILLDLTMPIMDGQQFLTIKEADPALAHIPVVVMTAVWDCSQLMIDHRVSECLLKPTAPGALLDALERAAQAAMPDPHRGARGGGDDRAGSGFVCVRSKG
jgi:CheY-like chemotaxis protein